MLILHDIAVSYGMIAALKGVSLRVEQGEIVALIGANGAGKSTTLMAVSGVTGLKGGTVSYEGSVITGLPPHAVVEKGISQVPEGRRIFPRMTVLENLELGAFTRDPGHLEDDVRRVYGLFPVLEERSRQLGGTLSGGEQQMLAIGRALMPRPRLLLLDEPSLGLAPIIVSRIFKIIEEINRQGTTILLVEQNALMALAIAGRGYILQTGEIVLADAAASLAKNPEVQKAYLGA